MPAYTLITCAQSEGERQGELLPHLQKWGLLEGSLHHAMLTLQAYDMK